MGDALGSNQFSSVAQLYLTLCNPMNCSTPGLPVHHRLLEFTQTHVHSFQIKQPRRHCWDRSRFRTLGSQVGHFHFHHYLWSELKFMEWIDFFMGWTLNITISSQSRTYGSMKHQHITQNNICVWVDLGFWSTVLTCCFPFSPRTPLFLLRST